MMWRTPFPACPVCGRTMRILATSIETDHTSKGRHSTYFCPDCATVLRHVKGQYVEFTLDPDGNMLPTGRRFDDEVSRLQRGAVGALSGTGHTILP